MIEVEAAEIVTRERGDAWSFDTVPYWYVACDRCVKPAVSCGPDENLCGECNKRSRPMIEAATIASEFVRHIRPDDPMSGRELLNALAEVFDLPQDCYGLDITIRIDDVMRIAVHRVPGVG